MGAVSGGGRRCVLSLTRVETHKTELRVVETFERLLAKKSFRDISISQICEEAGISRATFYYHFSDKYAISQWYYGIVAEMYLFQTGRTLTWFQANYLNTAELAKHETLYRWCFNMSGYDSLFEHAKRRRIETLQETIVEYKHVKLSTELEFQIISLADAEVGGISRWFKDGMPYDVKQLCLYLDNIVPRQLYRLLNKPVDETLQPLLKTP